MSRRRLAALVAAVLLQLAVLGGLFVYSQYPLWVGTEVRLATVPVDPRDLFRGQYVRLNYALSRQPLPEMELPRAGDPVFILLRRDGPLWRADGVRLREPDGERLYLRGTIERVSGGELHIRYGIEAWFAAPEQALRLERELAEGGVARVRIAPDGRAALVAVEAGGGASAP